MDYIELDICITNSYPSGNMVVTVSVNVLAADGARPSACSVLSAKLDMIFFQVSLAGMISIHLSVSSWRHLKWPVRYRYNLGDFSMYCWVLNHWPHEDAVVILNAPSSNTCSCDIAVRRMPQNNFDDKSTLVKIMTGCRHMCLYLNH